MYTEKEVVLGGIKQVIALEGPDSGPFMIMFHGGPWGPVIYGHAFRGYYPVLYKHVGLVWWDQYGCGRNHVEHVDETICDMRQAAVHFENAAKAYYTAKEKAQVEALREDGGIQFNY